MDNSKKFNLKNKKNAITILVIAIILAVLFLGYLISDKENNKNHKKNQMKTVSNNTIDLLEDSENSANLNTEDITDKITQNQENSENKELTENDINYSTDTLGNNIELAESEEVNIVMVGDVLLHTPVSDSGLMADGTYNYDHLFKNIKNDIQSADIAIANQEVILGGRELGLSGYPAFNGAYEVGDALVNSGFDVILHATNHALDKGTNGINNCLSFWKNTYPQICVVGIYDSYEAQQNIYVKDIKGIKVAILNYTYGTNGIPLPSDMPFAVNLIDREQIARDVNKAKELADFVMVCPHWGIEYTHSYNNEQEDLAIYLTELGVDLIIGTHPHVIQGVEWIESENGNKSLVYYSLGNFINSTSDYGDGIADRMVGAMSDVTIKKDLNGEVKIIKYAVKPLVTHLEEGTAGITTYKISDYNNELASINKAYEHDSNFSYEYIVNLSNQIFNNIEVE